MSLQELRRHIDKSELCSLGGDYRGGILEGPTKPEGCLDCQRDGVPSAATPRVRSSDEGQRMLEELYKGAGAESRPTEFRQRRTRQPPFLRVPEQWGQLQEVAGMLGGGSCCTRPCEPWTGAFTPDPQDSRCPLTELVSEVWRDGVQRE